MKSFAQGYELDSVKLRRRVKDVCNSGHLKLGIAYAENRGVRLSAKEVEDLVIGDEAVAQAIYNLQSPEDATWLVEEGHE